MACLQVPFLQRKPKTFRERNRTDLTKYKALYRFEEPNVEWIAEHFLGRREETRGGALTNKQRMQIFLRYMADPGFQIGVGEDIGVDQSTVSKTVTLVSFYYACMPKCSRPLSHLTRLPPTLLFIFIFIEAKSQSESQSCRRRRKTY
jgi:hypothetical protein